MDIEKRYGGGTSLSTPTPPRTGRCSQPSLPPHGEQPAATDRARDSPSWGTWRDQKALTGTASAPKGAKRGPAHPDLRVHPACNSRRPIMAALAVCATTAALARPAPSPARPPELADHPPLPAPVLLAAPAPSQS